MRLKGLFAKVSSASFVIRSLTKVNNKYQGPKDVAPLNLLLIFENANFSEFFAVPWGSSEFLGVPWGSSEFLRVP